MTVFMFMCFSLLNLDLSLFYVSYSKFLYMSLWGMHGSHVFFIVGSSNRTCYNSVFLCSLLWVSLCWCVCWCALLVLSFVLIILLPIFVDGGFC